MSAGFFLVCLDLFWGGKGGKGEVGGGLRRWFADAKGQSSV